MKNFQTESEKVKQILGLTSSLVGVKFINSDADLPVGIDKLTGHRYCQALMKARHGAHVLLDAEGISCPAAAAAFGFKPLPDGLKTGKGLVGFGIETMKWSVKPCSKAWPHCPRQTKSLIPFPARNSNHRTRYCGGGRRNRKTDVVCPCQPQC
jgi:uncharacterized protein (DUF169 family)